jgi:hypothetical protein
VAGPTSAEWGKKLAALQVGWEWTPALLSLYCKECQSTCVKLLRGPAAQSMLRKTKGADTISTPHDLQLLLHLDNNEPHLILVVDMIRYPLKLNNIACDEKDGCACMPNVMPLTQGLFFPGVQPPFD